MKPTTCRHAVLNKMIYKPNSVTFSIVAIALAVTFSYFVIDRKEWVITKQKFLLETHTTENRLLLAQLTDYEQNVFQFRQEEYRKGFEDGKTQIGVSMMQGSSMVGYSDGYHAALTQFDPSFTQPLDTTDPVTATFITLYEEALVANNKDDATFYKDMVVAQLRDELSDAFPETLDSTEEAESLLGDWVDSDAKREDHTTLELLEQVLDSLEEPSSTKAPPPSVGDAFQQLNKPE
jgi:hypothetical protein